METTHYKQEPKRNAEFITPPNILKQKVGFGGISEEILNKAQALLENNSVDFRPLGEMYLEALARGIDYAKKSHKGDSDYEALIATMLYPAMQLKANGGMFQYQLITEIADRLIQFLEVIDQPDKEAIEIISAFYTTLKAVLMGQIKGDGGEYGKELKTALVAACFRYFEKYPENATLTQN